MSETFCPLPWNFQAIRANGDLRVCCQSNITEGRGILKKPNGQSYNASTDDLSEARNADIFKRVRQSILKGQWDENCSRCRQEEEAGLNSRRLYEKDRWQFSFDEALRLTSDDGAVTSPQDHIVYYDLRFGNLCNLKCRMCGPTDSSAWYEDWVQMTGNTHFADTHGKVELESIAGKWRTSAYDWHYSETFWRQLENQLGHIQYIYMAGGEPLLIKKHYDFLEECIRRNYAKNIILEYNTNCTRLPEKVLTMWQSFKGVRVGASIDGFGDVLEYQRYPAKWEEIYKNLQILNEQPSNVLPWLAFTVTTYNIFHIVDFMKWKLTESGLNQINRTNHRPIITPHMAHSPQSLNIRVLPLQLKAEVSRRLNAFVDWLAKEKFSESVQIQGKSISQSIIKYMNAQHTYDKHWKDFCNYTSKLDKIRNQSLLKVCPEYTGFFKEQP